MLPLLYWCGYEYVSLALHLALALASPSIFHISRNYMFVCFFRSMPFMPPPFFHSLRRRSFCLPYIYESINIMPLIICAYQRVPHACGYGHRVRFINTETLNSTVQPILPSPSPHLFPLLLPPLLPLLLYFDFYLKCQTCTMLIRMTMHARVFFSFIYIDTDWNALHRDNIVQRTTEWEEKMYHRVIILSSSISSNLSSLPFASISTHISLFDRSVSFRLFYYEWVCARACVCHPHIVQFVLVFEREKNKKPTEFVEKLWVAFSRCLLVPGSSPQLLTLFHSYKNLWINEYANHTHLGSCLYTRN